MAQTPANFVFTDTEGLKWNLYEELGKGKTVILDFFFVDCKPCQRFTPMIQSIYEEHGEDTGAVLVFGISDRDDNQAVKAFEAVYGVTYPSCGYEGGGDTITDYFRLNNTFLGWPTYAIVCPDTSMYWNLEKSDSFPSIRDSLKQCPEPVLSIHGPKLLESNMRIWYNTSSHTLGVLNLTDEPIESIQIFDNQGRLVQSLAVLNSNEIGIDPISKGMYFVEINTKTKQVIQKLLKTIN
ncbi:MAG: thiol-disulfide isomerase/thioredoxin [Bacteroidia bacterium]|jgi:thiol-disulfide isomerase/thioredoxin